MTSSARSINLRAVHRCFTTALYAGLPISLMLTTACNTTSVKNENTLTSLDQTSISLQDEKVEDSLHRAMESYREYIRQAPASSVKPEAIHRPADPEVEESYRIEGVEAPAEPGANAAISHYTRLLTAYPLHDHNDRVLYQLSRAYEETGEKRKAADALEKLAAGYAEFERMDEVKFRLGEYYFSEKKYIEANKAYDAVLAYGEDNKFYESALKKQGWTYFKQDQYTQSLDYFTNALDYKLSQDNVAADLSKSSDNKQFDDIYRAISLNFSYMGGANAIKTYVEKSGKTLYEKEFYRQLAEYHVSKDRYTDAAKTYQAYIDNHPFSETSPAYALRIIEIYKLGGFYNLATEARKKFAGNYNPQANYWKKLDPADYPAIDEFQKTNIRALASSYHVRFRKLENESARRDSYNQAVHWYREYYYLYPLDEQAALMSKLLAELYLENGDYHRAALEFERIAKNDLTTDIAADSAYAALFAYRENLKSIPDSRQRSAREDIAESSLWFADNFPQHAETGAVLTAAAYDFLLLNNYASATATAERVITQYSQADKSQTLSAWIVMADATFESRDYVEAEMAYKRVLEMTESGDNKHAALTDNLAASIYKQAEYAKKRNDHGTAAQHFLRLKTVAPNASLSTTAQYEAASELVTIGEWKRAAIVLEDFQKQNPTHELAEVTTRNLAAIYRKSDDLLKSADKLEHVAKTSKDESAQREALLQAAELYRQADKQDESLRVYIQYTEQFPSPAEDAIEAYRLIADIYKSKNDIRNYHKVLWKIVSIDEKAGEDRTDRTRYVAAQSMLTLAQTRVYDFNAVNLTRPFKKQLELKKKKMSAAIELLTRLLEYQVSDTTTAATYYIAEIYLHFSQALTGSERPGGLNELELEQYNLALEEQVYLFEEKAIGVYQKNTELLDVGIHDPWIEKSIARLSELFPAQYAKQEQKSGYLKSLFARDDRT